jgi:hypothetical protein
MLNLITSSTNETMETQRFIFLTSTFSREYNGHNKKQLEGAAGKQKSWSLEREADQSTFECMWPLS